MDRRFRRILLAGCVLTLGLGCSSQAARLKSYFKESDPLVKALVKRFDEAALKVQALEREVSDIPNADPFMAERQSKLRAMAEEVERAQADVEIVRRQVEALRVPQEGQLYHNRVLAWVRLMEDCFLAQKKLYEYSVTFWTGARSAEDWAAYLLQYSQAQKLSEQLKQEIYGIDKGRRELAAQFGLPSPPAR